MSTMTANGETCTACGSQRSEQLMRLKDGAYRRCSECGCIFACPIPDNLEQINEESFTQKLDYYGAKIHTQRRRSRKKLSMFTPYRQTGNLLEIGCNAGAVLDVARQMGWNVQGVELCVSASRFARERLGLDVFTGTVEAARFPSNHFDVVYTNAVLEHLRSPLSVMRESCRILRPGGVFYADTVNWDSYTRRLLDPRWKYLAPRSHVHLFTPANMLSLCRQAGLEHVRTWTAGVRMEAGTNGSQRCPSYWHLLKPVLSFMARRADKGDHIRLLSRKPLR